jgi:organic radical activating enzyme
MTYNLSESQKLVEWEVTMACNYTCEYCTNLDKTLRATRDKDTLDKFIQMLGNVYPGIEIFVFGGEPFLHPEIGFIVERFNAHNIPFVIQTNLSKLSQEKMKDINDPMCLQVSIHPSQVSVDELKILDKSVNIRVVDVMYIGKKSVEYYLKVKNWCENVFLTPVTDFGDGVSDTHLQEYNRIKKSKAWNKIINFENVKRLDGDRSDAWVNHSPRGKQCLYNNRYFLYGPDLRLYNCCHRTVHDGICNHDKCFLM